MEQTSVYQEVAEMSKTVIRLGEVIEEYNKTAETPMTLERLAYEAKLNYATVRRWRANKINRIDLPTLDALCKVLNCEPGDLLVWRE